MTTQRAKQVETEAKDKADTELLLHFTILSPIIRIWHFTNSATIIYFLSEDK